MSAPMLAYTHPKITRAASAASKASASADADAADAAAYKKIADILCVELAAAPVGVAP